MIKDFEQFNENISNEDRISKLHVASYVIQMCKACKTNADIIDRIKFYIEKYNLNLKVEIKNDELRIGNGKSGGVFYPMSFFK